jgi:hypothetical protein
MTSSLSSPSSGSVPRYWPLRLFAGLALMPPAAALVGFAIFPVYWWLAADSLGAGHVRGDTFEAARAFGLATGLVATFVTVLAALPLVNWVVARGRALTLRRTVLWGVVLGNSPAVLASVVALLLGAVSADADTIPNVVGILVRGVGLGTTTGAACAALFWAVVPDPAVTPAALPDPRG